MRVAGRRGEVPTENVEPREHQPEPDADALSVQLQIRALVARLEPLDQQLLMLRYGHDLTQPAVARALDLAEGTAKVRLHRARARLRAALEEEP